MGNTGSSKKLVDVFPLEIDVSACQIRGLYHTNSLDVEIMLMKVLNVSYFLSHIFMINVNEAVTWCNGRGEVYCKVH